jgi:hypothetical protein
MSIRPNFYGVDLEKFKSTFGSKNEQAADEMFRKYEEDLVIVDGKKTYEVGREEDRKLIVDAVMEGGDKGLALENEHPYLLFNLMALQDGVVYTDSNDWRGYHIEYFEALMGKVDGDERTLIEYFWFGRKIFEEGMTETEFPYAYLTRMEMKTILRDMDRHWEKYNDTEGFGEELKGWMTEFVEKDKDLFFTQG